MSLSPFPQRWDDDVKGGNMRGCFESTFFSPFFFCSTALLDCCDVRETGEGKGEAEGDGGMEEGKQTEPKR